jgi:acetyl-CoA acyltransferase
VRDAVLVDLVRSGSARGKPGGALHGLHPADLLGSVLSSLLGRCGLDPVRVDDVIAGCVVQYGDQSMNVARTAALVAGLPESVPATTIDRQCGSSQQAAHFAAQGVMAGAYDIVIACGVESMSRVPMGSNIGRGDAFGPLSARYPEGLVGQGVSAELVASRWDLDRDTLDEYAARSHARAAAVARSGGFAREIVPVEAPDRQGAFVADETIRESTNAEGLSSLKPAFFDQEVAERFPDVRWAVTPGNSSPLTDGASAALIMAAETAERLGLRPRARFHSFAVAGSDPLLMLTGVIPATQKLLQKSGLALDDIDVYEVNEAFASVPLAWASEFHADPERLNPRGGAIALGHPLGASGTRILATMVNHLEATGGRYGLQTMCEGGGMANAMIVERI